MASVVAVASRLVGKVSEAQRRSRRWGILRSTSALGILQAQNSIAHNYILKQNSIARIYFSITSSRVYISAEKHCPSMLVYIRTLGVASHGSGDPWEWRHA